MIQRKNLAIISGSLVVSASIIWMYHDASIFKFMYLVIFTAIVLAITVLTGIGDLVLKTKSYHYPGVLLVSLIIGVIGILSLQFRRENLRHDIAETIVQKLEEHKDEHGIYPSHLNSIEIDRKGFRYYYKCDSSVQYFVFGYLLNSWHRKEYDSETQEWRVTD